MLIAFLPAARTTTAPLSAWSVPVPLILTVVGVSAAGFALFWGLTLFLQRYLYNEPADKLPLRAAVGGLLLGCFIGFWCYVNTRADGENKYGVIHQFSPNDVSPPVAKFVAERKKLDTNQKAVGDEAITFERQLTEKGQRYLPTNPKPTGEPKPFAVTAAGYYTHTLVVEHDGQPVRYEAVMNDKQQYPQGAKYTFVEKGSGGRTIEISRGLDADPAEPVQVVAPSGGAVFLALALNALHLVVWFAIFWPVLRFNVGHAIGLAVVFFAMGTVLLMPLLFQMNALPKGPPAMTQPTTKS
jgi:hypothetical protein